MNLDDGGFEWRGVSPVVGVILMVAIVIILATVLAVFVLGMGNLTGTPSVGVGFDETGEGVRLTLSSVQQADTVTVNANGSDLHTWNGSDIGSTVSIVGVSAGDTITIIAGVDGEETVIQDYTVESDNLAGESSPTVASGDGDDEGASTVNNGMATSEWRNSGLDANVVWVEATDGGVMGLVNNLPLFTVWDHSGTNIHESRQYASDNISTSSGSATFIVEDKGSGISIYTRDGAGDSESSLLWSGEWDSPNQGDIDVEGSNVYVSNRDSIEIFTTESQPNYVDNHTGINPRKLSVDGDQNMYYVDWSSEDIVRLNSAGGEEWRETLPHKSWEVVVLDGSVYLADTSGSDSFEVRKYDSASGVLQDSNEYSVGGVAELEAHNGEVYIGGAAQGGGGYYGTLDTDSLQFEYYQTSTGVDSFDIHNGDVYTAEGNSVVRYTE